MAFLLLASCAREGSAPPAEERMAEPPPTEPLFTRVGAAMLGRRVADGNWPVFGGTYANQRYASLNQVNRRNVGELVPAWIFQTEVNGSFSTTPLVIDNVMYLTTPESGVIALNAGTGEELWRFEPELGTRLLCCGPENHGVAAWHDKVFVGTLDARLIALDHRSGEVVWEITVAEPGRGHSLTMAPLAADGRIIIGVSGGEFGIRGFLDAYDVEDGDRVWRWYTVPAPDEAPNGWWGEWRELGPFGEPLNRDIVQEIQDSARVPNAWERGGGAVRMTPAYDPESRTLFFGVGHPAPNLDGSVRPGDNLYTSSIVALDATEGSLRWYFQYVPHNRWDLDASSPPFLFEQGGRRFVGHAGKTGWLYVLDAESGEPLLRSENFVPQENLFTPPTTEGVRMLPGADGGAAWSPAAYSPRTGLAYVLGIHQPMIFSRSTQPFQQGQLWLGGSFTLLPDEERYGTLSAIDLRTGQIRWQHRVPEPLLGSALVTAGDVLFVGQGHGTFDAFDAATGDLLWQFHAGAGVHGGPVTYTVGGVQYVAVAAGGHVHMDTQPGNSVFAFTLPDLRPGGPEQAYDQPQYRRVEPMRLTPARQHEPERRETEAPRELEERGGAGEEGVDPPRR